MCRSDRRSRLQSAECLHAYPDRPYRWRIVAGRQYLDRGDGPREVAALITHRRRIISLSGSLPPDRMARVVLRVLVHLSGRPVELPPAAVLRAAVAGEGVRHG